MAKTIALTKGKVAIIDEEDFEMVSKLKWSARVAKNTTYAVTSLKDEEGKRKAIGMHRFIMGLKDFTLVVDHKDRNGLNNKRSNLRVCTQKQNCQNKTATGRSKYLGVSWHEHRKVWRARILFNGLEVGLGTFKCEKLAAKAYNEGAKKCFGEFANLNKIERNTMATVKLELRNRPDKNEMCLLRAIVQDKGRRIFVAMPIKLMQSDWDTKNQKVKTSHPQAVALNNVLKLKVADLQGKMAKEGIKGEISLSKVAGRDIEKTSFKAFAESLFKVWDKTKALNSVRAYKSMLNVLLEFDPKATLQDITPDWLARYEDHSRTVDGTKAGGTLKRMAFVSVIIKEAVRKQLVQLDPFTIYRRPKKINPEKIWLTMDEINAIEKFATETESGTLKVTAWWFLLSCYTGLRYGDIENFDRAKLVRDGRLILYTQKTKDIVSIKTTKKINQILDTLDTLPKVFTNQKSNFYLKHIAHFAGINKSIAFHTGRHTFAVQCANLKIGIEVTSKLLGHSNIKTTDIYYKIINTVVDDEMEKWDK